MKKLSLKAKKTIIYVVTVALIVALISGVILSLGVVRAGAYNDEELMLANSAQVLEFTPQDVEDHNPVMDKNIGNLTLWSGELYYMKLSNDNELWYFPNFSVNTDNFDSSTTGSYQLVYIPIAIIFRTRSDNVDLTLFNFNYTDSGGYMRGSQDINYFVSNNYGIALYLMSFTADRGVQSITDFRMAQYAVNFGDLDVVGAVMGTNMTDVITRAVEIKEYYNYQLNPPSFVEGTDEFTTYDYSETQNMLYANLTPVWDPFYAGFVGRVATADGTSVPVMYTWTIDGLNATNGNVVVLDPAYHDYVTQLSLQSHVSNGSLELLIDKTMDVRYIAVSDDLTLLSADLIDQANKLQLIQDEINAAFNDGYLEGYELGLKKALAGVFGNAQMNVALYVYDPVTGEEAPLIYNVPLNVANGGMDLTSIWKLWSDSPLNDGNHTLSWIQVTISFDNGVLWSNDLLYFKFNTPVAANQLPYDAYLLTVENSSQNYNVSFVERNGLWYWQTAASLDGYSVSDISFKINNQHISYYDFLEGYNTTLNNNIQTFGTNQASYDRGFDDGYVDGVDDGFSDGIAQSSQVSWMEGHSAGYDEGRNVGYNVGYEDGLRDDFRFYDLFFSLFDAELNVFKSIVSFEIFGVNVAGFVLGLVTIGVVAFVIRKVW